MRENFGSECCVCTGGRKPRPPLGVGADRGFYLLVVEKLMLGFNEYMARAAQCQQKAENARNEDDKQSWLALADSWRYTAELQQRPQVRKSREAA